MKFRFYDPRVLGKFLPTCNGGELRTLFGEVETFYTEAESDDALMRYRIENGKLNATMLNKES